MKMPSTLSLCLLTGFALLGQSSATTVLHYRVNDTDAANVAAGTVPGFDGSADGAAIGAGGTLSADVPTVGVPAGAGNRSLSFAGDGGFNLPGTQQLLNSTIDANGGFTLRVVVTLTQSSITPERKSSCVVPRQQEFQ
jgi:hypothetical protein